eukprot:CAMPEP_0201491786 /NCGR_PEP_ID=MMETSP0151_2-20130828/31212_1 /ASSEMBLY_ACC=CAM_ASM_000257 /TAXON_ID=200890 /ORGANISM="Paramoeba atlantica, Strain 621/1 / CCAP 1560/9" /LENGTH=431 /DNA_ID=CAMNT_0047878305 /DNA_START=135 /DNA_END=1430 /DNA_ORIENTATION=-
MDEDYDDDDFGGVDVGEDDDFGGVDVGDDRMEDDDFGGVDVDPDDVAMHDTESSKLSLEENHQLCESLKEKLKIIIEEREKENLFSFVKIHLRSDNTLLKKEILRSLVSSFQKIANEASDYVLETGRVLVEQFGDIDSEEMHDLRRVVAKELENRQSWSQAASTLEGIDIKGRIKEELSVEVCHHFAVISNFYLKAGMVQEAEQAINQCSQYLPKPNPVFYTDTWAKIHGHKHDFIKAAICNIHLMQSADQGNKGVSNTALGYLEEAAICALLAPAGSHRLRILGTICKDERSDRLPFNSLLKKTYSERIITSKEKQDFRNHLRPHQQAGSDGVDVLDKACIEHNILSAGNIYNNISFSELGLLLGLDKHTAEQIAARMIMEDRLTGFLDQIEGLLYFREADQMSNWSANIALSCARVVQVMDLIAKQQPS